MRAERRRVARYAFFASVKTTDIRTQTIVRARTNELSRYGCYLDMMSPLPLGTKIRVEIEHGGKVFQADGVVVYSQLNLGMGISFTAIAEPHGEILESWLRDLKPVPA